MFRNNPLAKEFVSRRRFMLQTAAGFSAAWAATHWPAMVSAAEHAHNAAKAPVPPKFEFLTAEEAREVDAISARIIPTDDVPGAREAGVVFFIDRALVTFAKDNQKLYREGLPQLQARVREMNPGKARFSELAPGEQDAVLLSLDENHPSGRRAFRSSGNASNFFDTVRQHTISGFLIDPESDRHGNKDGVGWQVIGRDSAHAFQSPFGFYDKDYPGWKSADDEGAKS